MGDKIQAQEGLYKASVGVVGSERCCYCLLLLFVVIIVGFTRGCIYIVVLFFTQMGTRLETMGNPFLAHSNFQIRKKAPALPPPPLSKLPKPRTCPLTCSAIQSKTPLTARRLIPPPIRHRDDLARAKKKENQQHVQIKSRVERRSQNVVVARPQVVSVPVRPVHDHEAADDGAEVAGADVAVEVGEAGEEDGGVPEVEFGAGEAAVQAVDDDGEDCADEEAEGHGVEKGLCEETLGTLGDCNVSGRLGW